MSRVCKDCKKSEATYGPRCNACHRAYKRASARKLRERKRKELVAKNDELEKSGRKVCSYCFHVRFLTEFSTSQGGGAGKRNKVCDRCLSQIYKSRGSGLDYKFWRRRAYSCNCAARAQQRRRQLRAVGQNELSYVCKPQHLKKLFENQGGVCPYCGVELDERNLGVDHKNPLSKSKNAHTKSNLQLVCKDCNNLKGNRTGKEFETFLAEYSIRLSSRTSG